MPNVQAKRPTLGSSFGMTNFLLESKLIISDPFYAKKSFNLYLTKLSVVDLSLPSLYIVPWPTPPFESL